MAEETKIVEKVQPKAPEKKAEGYYALVLIRGLCNVRTDIKDTIRMLGLTKKNSFVIRKQSESILGMIKKVKDYVAYGTVDETVVKKYGLKTTVNLHPPRGGFEKKGIKVPYSTGGALGNRGDKMAVLIEKMHK